MKDFQKGKTLNECQNKTVTKCSKTVFCGKSSNLELSSENQTESEGAVVKCFGKEVELCLNYKSHIRKRRSALGALSGVFVN